MSLPSQAAIVKYRCWLVNLWREVQLVSQTILILQKAEYVPLLLRLISNEEIRASRIPLRRRRAQLVRVDARCNRVHARLWRLQCITNAGIHHGGCAIVDLPIPLAFIRTRQSGPSITTQRQRCFHARAGTRSPSNIHVADGALVLSDGRTQQCEARLCEARGDGRGSTGHEGHTARGEEHIAVDRKSKILNASADSAFSPCHAASGRPLRT